eukprot:gene27344-biopygen17836
MSRGGCSRAE